MQAIDVLVSPAVSIPGSDIDTDQIIPARFMHVPREDYGRYCFHDLRYDDQGQPRPDFPLNQATVPTASILVADRNFGCGSSREHAVYTLYDHGIRAILAPSFGEIFHINCCKNGLLPVIASEQVIEGIRRTQAAAPAATLRIDLPAQAVTDQEGRSFHFDIDPFSKHCMVLGLDELDYTLQFMDDIRRHEAHHAYPQHTGAAGPGHAC